MSPQQRHFLRVCRVFRAYPDDPSNLSDTAPLPVYPQAQSLLKALERYRSQVSAILGSVGLELISQPPNKMPAGVLKLLPEGENQFSVTNPKPAPWGPMGLGFRV